MSLPSKQACFYILEMIDAELLEHRHIHPWADGIIMELDAAPTWLSALAIHKDKGEICEALREYIFSEPFEPMPDDMEKFHAACLWLRYERRELSWASFLRLNGEQLDAANADWDCETPYRYLNEFEASGYSKKCEAETRRNYLAHHNLTPWKELAKTTLEPFSRARKIHPSTSA